MQRRVDRRFAGLAGDLIVILGSLKGNGVEQEVGFLSKGRHLDRESCEFLGILSG